MLDPTMPQEALWTALPALSGEDLSAVLNHASTTERHILKILGRKDLSSSFLALTARSSWMRFFRLQAAVVNHPATPLADSLNLVKNLFWKDLNRTLLNVKVPAEVRHQAELHLIQRLPVLTIGEKITLARCTAGQPLKQLRFEKDPRIVKGLLENSRLVEDDVLFLASQPKTPAPVLETIARDPRWQTRREVRLALLRNAHTPLAAALTFVGALTLPEIRGLVEDQKVPLVIRKMLGRRLGRS